MTLSPQQRLEVEFTATRLSFKWLGVRKTLTDEQKEVAAHCFGAEGNALSAAKKLLDTKHAAYKAVSAVKSQCGSYWKGMSLPFPEPGIRLIKQDDLGTFNEKITSFQAELAAAVAELDDHYVELKVLAAARLGELFNEADYPASLGDAFQITWNVENIAPPDYLMELKPELYEREIERMRARLQQAADMAEQAFIDEFSEMVTHLADALQDGDKKFRDGTITKVTEFFERFRHMDVSGNNRLGALVEEANRLVSGVDPTTLRNHSGLRSLVADKMACFVKQGPDLRHDRVEHDPSRFPIPCPRDYPPAMADHLGGVAVN